MASPLPGAIGRGRGRGRGVALKHVEEKPTSPCSEPTFSNKPLIEKLVQDLAFLSVTKASERVLSEVELLKCENDMEAFVTTLSERSMKEPDFASQGALLCNIVWSNHDMHSQIRTPLLRVVQQFYVKREELRKRQPESYYGFAVFLCELYRLLRVKNSTLKPLVPAVVAILLELLKCESSESILYFYQEFEKVGPLILSDDKGKLDEIVNAVRERIIMDSMKPACRCRLVQAIELCAAGFTMPLEVQSLYDDIEQDLIVNGE